MAKPDFEAHVEDALAALGRAQEVARQRAIKCGTPFVVSGDGKMVDENPTTAKFRYEEGSASEAPAVVREEPEED